MKTSPDGIALIKASEGLRLVAYRDGGGVLTIGYGHTKGVRAAQQIDREEAIDLLMQDVAEAEKLVNAHLAGPIPQPAFDALVDFAFNLGGQGFINPGNQSPTGLKRALGAKQYDRIPGELLRWVYDNGKRVPGLLKRRQAEIALWNKGFAA